MELMRSFYSKIPILCFLSQSEVFNRCHAYGAVFYQAHPFREPCVPQRPEYLDGVEYNQRPEQWESRMKNWMCGGKDYPELRLISGSDCHDLDQVGYGGIEIEENVDNIKEIVAIMKKGNYRLITTPV